MSQTATEKSPSLLLIRFAANLMALSLLISLSLFAVTLRGEKETTAESSTSDAADYIEPIPIRYSKLANVTFPPTVVPIGSSDMTGQTINFIDEYSSSAARALKVWPVEGFAWSVPYNNSSIPRTSKDDAKFRRRIIKIFQRAGYQVKPNPIVHPARQHPSQFYEAELYGGFEAQKNEVKLTAGWTSAEDCLLLFIGRSVPQGKQRVLDDQLIWAAEEGQFKLLNQLLDSGAQPNALDYDGTPIINLAVQYRQKHIVRRLLEKGARFTNQSIEPAMYSAIGDGEAQIVSDLLDYGADPNGGSNWPYLIQAANDDRSDTGEIIELLLAKGAFVNKRDKEGITALMRAASTYEIRENPQAHIRVMEILLRHGADINARDNIGETALFKALTTHGSSAVKLLIEQGANVNAVNREGLTPLQFVRRVEYPTQDYIDLLIKNGAHE